MRFRPVPGLTSLRILFEPILRGFDIVGRHASSDLFIGVALRETEFSLELFSCHRLAIKYSTASRLGRSRLWAGGSNSLLLAYQIRGRYRPYPHASGMETLMPRIYAANSVLAHYSIPESS